jgi:type IV secretory pathway VirB6-like protein
MNPIFNSLDYFTQLQTATAGMMRVYSPEFLAIGMNVYTLSAFVKMFVIAWTIMFKPGSLEDANYLFGVGLFQIMLGFTIQTFYVPLTDLIIGQMAALTHILDASVVRLVVTTLDNILKKFIAPTGWMEILATLIYFLVFFFVTLAKVISLIVISFSLIAQAVLVLIGPLFCSLFLMPHFKRYFLGWMDSLIQYSFLQVLAYAYMVVGITLLGAVFSKIPNGLTSDLYLTYGVQVLMYIMAYVGGFFMLPSLNASLFAGVASSSMGYVTRVSTVRRWAASAS